MKKTVVAIILALTFTLAAVASAQLTHDTVRIKVPAGTSCPAPWTASTVSVTSESTYHVVIPAAIGGGQLLVSVDAVNAIWSTSAERAAAISSGILKFTAGQTVQTRFCVLE